MAKYNTFVVQNTKDGGTVLVTSSAYKVRRILTPDLRVEVWNENQLQETIDIQTRERLKKYTDIESEYIREKQAKAEERNRKRRAKP